AVEIQVLWREALLAGARLAEIAGFSEQTERWREIAAKVGDAFAHRFWDDGRNALYDRVEPDGTPDGRDRPNQVFALSLPGCSPGRLSKQEKRSGSQGSDELTDPSGPADSAEPETQPAGVPELLSPEQRDGVLERVLQTCVLSHGVASLSPSDPGFHPVHLDLDRYHFDEAYHNGDVWVWLTVPVVTALFRAGRVGEAWKQTAVLRDLLFNEGAAGTLPELRNGQQPASGENVAGTVSQAWSLAEFLRNFYQDYLGVRPDVPAGRLDLAPALPLELPWVSCPVTVAAGTVSLFFRTNAAGTSGVYRIAADEDMPELTIRFTAMVPPGANEQSAAGGAEAVLAPGGALEFRVEPDGDGWRTSVSTCE
ncbi:hypothetical protein K8S17_06315, partial [bacterium]|nr:hypothetical protein [bacterium]